MKSKSSKHYLITILTLLVGVLHGQMEYQIKQLTPEDGLSQVTILDLLLDDHGLLWISTQDGVDRFDGNIFKSFKHESETRSSISSNEPTQMDIDTRGRIWIGSERAGVSYYDYKTDGFTKIILEDSPSFITDIFSDRSEDILYASTQENGLYKLKFAHGKIEKEKILSDHINTIGKAREKIILGAADGQVFLEESNQNDIFHKLTQVEGNVNCFFTYKDKLFIGSSEGLFSYDEITKKVDKILLNDHKGEETKHVTSFLAQDDKTIWIATGNGLFLFDLEMNKSIQKISIEKVNGQSLSNNTIQSMVRISEDAIAVGTANNLNIIDFSPPFFKSISGNKHGEQLLNDNVIFAIEKDGDDLWVGTTDGGVSLIRDGRSYHFYKTEQQGREIEGTVRTIKVDPVHNRLWVATTRGLHMTSLPIMDPAEVSFRSFHHVPDDLNSISLDFLKDIDIDESGVVWGASYGKGAFSLELNYDGKVAVQRYDAIDAKRPLVHDFCQVIVCHKDQVWVGTEGGLSQIEGTQVTNYVATANDSTSLTHNSVYDIIFDERNDMWVACRNGLNKYTREGNFKNWRKKEDHPSSIIYSLQHDNDGNLWMGAKGAIIKFDPKTERHTIFSSPDGIHNNEFDLHAKYKDEEGTIYLGGIDGITYFDPSHLDYVDKEVPLYFSDIKVNGRSVDLNFKERHLNSSNINFANSIRLSKKDFPFSVIFSAKDFRLFKNIEYGYRLSSNEAWTILDNDSREILFMSLPMGKSTLEVNGYSRGERWTSDPLKMEIRVIPPWWLRWWSIIIYAATLAFIVYQIYRYQLSKKLLVLESQRLREIDKLKNDLYANVTHEFRTPLTVIMGLTEKMKHLPSSESSHHDVEMIQSNSEKLLTLVNEILDLAKLENNNVTLNNTQSNVVDFVGYLVQSLKSLADRKGVELFYYPEEANITLDYDQEKLSTILVNLISNAIKYTQSKGKVIVHVASERQELVIKIKDNGRGILKADLPNIFNKYFQAKGDIIGSERGSGIGLALSKGTAKVMNGRITVTSKYGVGSTFAMIIPISNKAPLSSSISANSLPGQSSSSILLNSDEIRNEEKTTILLVEDNADVASYVKSCLKEYRVLYAKDGREGTDIAIEHLPDLIISDVMMPEMDGFQLCKTLKSNRKTDHIPIILLTARSEQKDKIFGISQGADAYIVKPFSKVELLTRINQLLESRRRMLKKVQEDGIAAFISKKHKDPKLVFLQDAIKHVHKNIDNVDFSAPHLSRLMMISESQLYKKLKAYSGKSTALFIRSIRLEEARNLLLHSDLSISQVAYETGFKDPSWFSRAFKREFGLTPSEVANDTA